MKQFVRLLPNVRMKLVKWHRRVEVRIPKFTYSFAHIFALNSRQIKYFCLFQLKTFMHHFQETPKYKRESSGSSTDRRSAKKQRTDSNASSNNRLQSLSPLLNHSTPLRKSGSLLDRPANIARPVSDTYLTCSFLYFKQSVYHSFI